jgi:hypothetical protein
MAERIVALMLLGALDNRIRAPSVSAVWSGCEVSNGTFDNISCEDPQMYLTIQSRREVLYPGGAINDHTDHEKEIHDLSTQQRDPESNPESILFIDSCDGV